MDSSSSYEAIANRFQQQRSATVGVREVREWAGRLPRGGSVLDLGCGHGLPLSAVLASEGLTVFGVDASPALVEAFRRNVPGASVVCEAVQASSFFDRTFDGVLVWGLMFLLEAEDQRLVLRRVARALRPSGRFLFTAPAQAVAWQDAMTGIRSVSLGAAVYRSELDAMWVTVEREFEDEGQNHYYDAARR